MEHGHDRRFLTLSFCISFIPFLFPSYASPFSNTPLLGIHPLDEKYFQPEVIKCKDGSKSFTRDRVNDDFCDCLDGTDEPDCCDGSDEYDGSINCPNTCVMGGNIDYKTGSYVPTIRDMSSINEKETKSGVNLEDLIQKLKGLKVIIILQAVLIGCVVVFRIFHRRARSKRRRLR
ncbi:glucosidase 2 subunit beta isoform X2 [Carya illinoinensis]|uniref:Glucosidase II beta subunit N-terminal domain-containing protein n=1 Tax=Carya illinoinensis TaxID=32201 RepID=A0A922FHZ3_CARIL|nr:glucosidase 2 subunit beta isoform X2 [Carya illinoinensis]KAG6722746.1 hypothetical protein I3842_03G175600 [Carya illinoinensis]